MVLVYFLKGVSERHKQVHTANILQQQQKICLCLAYISFLQRKFVLAKAWWWKCLGTVKWGVAAGMNSYVKLLNCKKLLLHSHHRKHLSLPKEKSDSVLGWPQATQKEKLSASRYYKEEQTFYEKALSRRQQGSLTLGSTKEKWFVSLWHIEEHLPSLIYGLPSVDSERLDVQNRPYIPKSRAVSLISGCHSLKQSLSQN